MVDAMPDDLARPPPEALARMMLECARGDPTLVQRTRGRDRNPQTRSGELPAAQQEPLLSLASGSHAEPATEQHLEDLVSIAVSSAQEADHALQLAQAASRKANRRMWAFAGVGALGMMTGIAGIVDNHLNTAVDQKLTEISSEVQALDEQQHQTSNRLAYVASQVADGQEAAASAQQTTVAEAATPATSVQPTQPYLVSPVDTPQYTNYYSSPQQTNLPPTRRTWTTHHRQAVVPNFVVVIQRNIRGLFRWRPSQIRG
jgi:hypothetical protein